MSPVVLRKTTAAYGTSRVSSKTDASSVASTANPFSAPRPRMAAIPSGIESWRNPAVFEKTSTRPAPSPIRAHDRKKTTAASAASAGGTLMPFSKARDP
jgi:hypothetical protein